jgi:hypothetical protein
MEAIVSSWHMCHAHVIKTADASISVSVCDDVYTVGHVHCQQTRSCVRMVICAQIISNFQIIYIRVGDEKPAWHIPCDIPITYYH